MKKCLFALVLLTSCYVQQQNQQQSNYEDRVRNIAQGYVGQPTSSLYSKSGAPIRVIQLDSNTRAFVYEKLSSTSQTNTPWSPPGIVVANNDGTTSNYSAMKADPITTTVQHKRILQFFINKADIVTEYHYTVE